MSALMSTFGEEAIKGLREAGREADLDSSLSANDPLYNTKPTIDPMQTIRQVAQPNQDSANQPKMNTEQIAAVKQREQITSKPVSTGAALGAGDNGGAARQQTAEKAATKLATDVAKLDKVIAGDAPKTASAGGSLAKTALGQGMGMAAAAGATVVAGPAAGAAVAAASVAYDVVKTFSGESQGSSFTSRADSAGYVASAAPAQPQQQAPSTVVNNFQNMMNVPGDRKLNGGDIELVSEGLCGIEKAPPLCMTPAAVALAGVYKNGGDALASRGEDFKPGQDKLEFKPLDMKSTASLFGVPKPGGLFA